MTANCIKVAHTTFTPKDGGEAIKMVNIFLDIDGLSDVVKVQISERKVQGSPAPGQVYIDCTPRFVKGQGMAWKPSLVRFS